MGVLRERVRVAPAGLDLSGLTDPIRRDELREFTRWAKSQRAHFPRQARAVFGTIVVLLIAPLLFLFGIAVVPMAISGASGATTNTGFAVFATVAIVVLAVVAILYSIRLLRRDARFGSIWRRWLRLTRFANANGMAFAASVIEPGYPGVIFHSGKRREATDVMAALSEPFFELGNYRYFGSQNERQRNEWGFVRIRLQRRIPHLMLIPTTGKVKSRLPVVFSRDQVLSLEGDFDRYFTLYAPKEYERDALYVLSPDLMVLLMDNAAPFTIEIVDDWMFVYSTKPFDMRDPSTYDRLGRIIAVVGAKTRRQTARYSDDRTADRATNVVAPAGRRLRGRLPIAATVGGILVLVFQLYRLFHGF